MEAETWWRKLLGFLARRWHGWMWLKPIRVPVILVIAGLYFLLGTDQGAEVVRALAERRSGDGHPWQSFWFFTACLAWSLSAWYWARVMLFLKLPNVPGQSPRLHGLRTWTPRVLGFVATLGVGVAFYRVLPGYGAQDLARSSIHFYGLWSTVGAFAFLAAATGRRKLARAAYRRMKIEALNLPRKEDVAYGTVEFKDLGRLTLGLLAAAIAVTVALFLLFVLSPQSAPLAMGSAAILLLAAAGWIAVGSTLDFAGMHLRYPVFMTLFVLAIVFSRWNDNHAVRTLDAEQPAERQDLEASLKAWMARHAGELKRSARPIPLYVVDAEGGGIRAAYWTVTVLGEIQNRVPCFAEHLFSLSGVSGGSLGASVFVALLAQSRPDEERGCAPPSFDVKDKAQQILSEDFLSPVAAAMLYPDLLQRFLFFPVERFDRGATLEQAWQDAWARHVAGPNRMSEPLDQLWKGKRHWTPALFLNATWVEAGKRIIASNLRVGAEKGSEDFVDIEDAQAFFFPRSLSLATATHMSARFTYVSPAGTLVKDRTTYGRVVDGGYFENSGATTTLEIVKAIDGLADADPLWKRVQVYVIHISNEPVDEQYADDRLESVPEGGNKRIQPKPVLNELLSPLWALLNARGARGMYARETLAWHVGQDHFLHFGLCRTEASVPLGWVLSRSTRKAMEDQLNKLKCETPQSVIFDNPANLKKIQGHFAQATRPPERQL